MHLCPCLKIYLALSITFPEATVHLEWHLADDPSTQNRKEQTKDLLLLQLV